MKRYCISGFLLFVAVLLPAHSVAPGTRYGCDCGRICRMVKKARRCGIPHCNGDY